MPPVSGLTACSNTRISAPVGARAGIRRTVVGRSRCPFLNEIKPDVHVNGSEYGENCIESETVRHAGGTIHVVERIAGLSTSRLVEALGARGATAVS
jgi:hypothetical protein